jgi:hypothetical protein
MSNWPAWQVIVTAGGSGRLTEVCVALSPPTVLAADPAAKMETIVATPTTARARISAPA